MTLDQKDLQQYDRKVKTRANLTLSTLRSISQNNSVADLMAEIESVDLISKGYTTRLWRHTKDVTLDNLYSHIVVSCKPQSYDSMKIKALGKRLDNLEEKIGEFNLEEGDYFILECIEHEKVAITSDD